MTTVRPIDKVAVIGAGVMGAGIAAHFANAGADVLLLDRVADGAQDRSTIARGAVQKLLKTDPAPLMHKSFAKRITPGNTEDDLESLRDCDWVVEAVLEDLAVKRSLYRAVCPYMRDDAVLSSNTSTLLWRDLADGLPDGTRSRFLITHFFNPPRYMRLMELVAPEAVAPQVIARVADFADRRLGKSVVSCRDTPGFIANRLGAYWLQVAVLEAMDRGVTVEEADAAMGPALGFPRMGVFGLLDLVGLDLMPHVLDSLQSALGADDPFQDEMRDWPLLRRLIAEGYTGRKGKGGFYRLDPEAKGQDAKIKQALNLTTGTYH
ncbi:MAG: 3-hydroxyacyl-CoA dehydrogenase family protein, partial [Rhodospirillales bacterium]